MITVKKGGCGMDLVKIGKYIAEKRKNLGLTQKQVAVSCGRDGVSQIPVLDVERGEVFPENAYVYYIAVQFNR